MSRQNGNRFTLRSRERRHILIFMTKTLYLTVGESPLSVFACAHQFYREHHDNGVKIVFVCTGETESMAEKVREALSEDIRGCTELYLIRDILDIDAYPTDESNVDEVYVNCTEGNPFLGIILGIRLSRFGNRRVYPAFYFADTNCLLTMDASSGIIDTAEPAIPGLADLERFSADLSPSVPTITEPETADRSESNFPGTPPSNLPAFVIPVGINVVSGAIALSRFIEEGKRCSAVLVHHPKFRKQAGTLSAFARHLGIEVVSLVETKSISVDPLPGVLRSVPEILIDIPERDAHTIPIPFIVFRLYTAYPERPVSYWHCDKKTRTIHRISMTPSGHYSDTVPYPEGITSWVEEYLAFRDTGPRTSETRAHDAFS